MSRRFALRAVQTSAAALMYCAEPLRRDTSFLLTAVRAQPEVPRLAYAPWESPQTLCRCQHSDWTAGQPRSSVLRAFEKAFGTA